METPLDDALFRNLVEAAPDGMLIADAAGRILVVNEQILRLFDYAREELIGQPVELLVPDQLRAHHRDHRAAYKHHMTTRPMGIDLELVGRRKDGGEIPVEIGLSPLQLPAGSITIAVIRDISERRRFAQEREALRVACETDQERQRIGMDLHDGIMQDIYAVSLGIEMTLADLGDAPTPAHCALNKAIDDLHNVVRDIRNYIFELRPRQFSGEVSLALIDLGREFQDNTSIRTEVSTSSRDPIPDEVSVAFYHIAHEALSNVRKYAQADHVSVLLHSGDGAVRMVVRDNGVGFDVSASPAESHRGLHNMSARATAAGGELEIRSAPGQGTQILVKFVH